MTTPLLGLSEISEGVINQATLHNTALRQMEARTFRALSRTTTTPAVGAAEADCYIIPAGATGVWSGRTNQMAAWIGGAWSYYTPVEGIGGIWVNDEDTAYSFDGSAWVATGGGATTAPFSDTTALLKGSGDSSKQVRFEVDGLTTATTRVITVPDANGTLAYTSDLAAYQPLDTDLTALAGLTSANNKIPYFTGSGTAGLLTRDTDTTLAANSDTVIATQKAVKAYVDTAITGGAADVMIFKGVIDCSANPNYPAADAGHLYKVSVAGLIGGGSGYAVQAGDTIYCITDSSASGNQATVGANWNVADADLTTTSAGALINGATSKSTPVDADYVGLMDSAASNILKKLSWANIKATLKTYFDTLYAAVVVTTKGDILTFSTVPARLGVGTDGYVLTASSAAATGLAWAAASGGSSGQAVGTHPFTTYAIDDTDSTKLVVFTHAGTAATAVSLAQAGTAGHFAANWWADFQNDTGGIVTITPATSTIDGAATLTLYVGQGARIVSDGTNYYTQRGGAGNAGFLGGTMTSAINEAPAVTIASASTVNIGAAAANTINISGTTTITAFDTIADGALRCLIFAGSLTLTHNATSLKLPSAANISTAAGDVAFFVSLGSGNWKCVGYQRADGTALSVSSGNSITGTTGGTGGTAAVTGGSSTTSGNTGGVVNVVGGTNTVAGNGGAINITGGAAIGSAYAGGDVVITGGAPTSGGTGGAAKLKGAAGVGNNPAGAAEVRSGSGNAPGVITIQSGDCSSFGGGGAINITVGSGNNAAGGNVAITAGAAGGSNTGGKAAIVGGAAGGSNSDGGPVGLKGGAATGTGAAGNVVLNDTGSALSTSAKGGFTCFPTCAGTPTGVPSTVPTGTVPMVFDTTNLKLYAYTGGAWKSTAAFT